MFNSSRDTTGSSSLHSQVSVNAPAARASRPVTTSDASSSARDTPSRAKTPPCGHQAKVDSATPRSAKPGPSLNSQSNHSEARKQDAPESRSTWLTMLRKGFFGIKDVSQFLNEMGTGKDVDMNDIVTYASGTLKKTAAHLIAAKQESDMTKPLIDYLNVLAHKIPAKTRPTFYDTSTTAFPSVDALEHYTKPDITGTKPGSSKPREWRWSHAGTVIELKHKTDIFDDIQERIRNSEQSEDALIQLAKSARSLLMESGSCHVYVVAVFDRVLARIFRFDRSGFSVTESFNFTTDSTHLPTFLWRLYNPDSDSTVMLGADDTISIPTKEEKKRMLDAVRKHPFYGKPSFDRKMDNSLWIRAARRDENTQELEIVRCFTFGSILSISDGLFSRATRVYRVILEEDVDKNPPTVYALKDAWPQKCRRSEEEFYRLIEKHCEEEANKDPDNWQKAKLFESIAKCHGSLDLSIKHDRLVHDPQLHLATSNLGKIFGRRHMRLLLTPVGTPLKEFKTTKSLVRATYSALLHHQVASEAGCAHRDISEGNVLFREVPLENSELNGFLLDWDYAELTAKGVDNFNKWFTHLPRAKKDDIDKSLKDVTGTFPFMAIEIIKNSMRKSATPVVHGVHHDLESFYWLLVWMVLRHTSLNQNPMACSKLFDYVGHAEKLAFVIELAPLNDGANETLCSLIEELRIPIKRQNIEEPFRSRHRLTAFRPQTTPVAKLTYEEVRECFEWHLTHGVWPENDAAIPYVAPSVRLQRREDDLRVTMQRKTASLLAEAERVASTSSKTLDVEGGSASNKRTASQGGLDESSPKKPKMATAPVQVRVQDRMRGKTKSSR